MGLNGMLPRVLLLHLLFISLYWQQNRLCSHKSRSQSTLINKRNAVLPIMQAVAWATTEAEEINHSSKTSEQLLKAAAQNSSVLTKQKESLKGGIVDKMEAVKIDLAVKGRKLALPVTTGNEEQETLYLALSTTFEGVYLFQFGTSACRNGRSPRGDVNGTDSLQNMIQGDSINDEKKVCYDYRKSHNARWCHTEQDMLCNTTSPAIFSCKNETLMAFVDFAGRYMGYFFDGIRIAESHIEGSDVINLFAMVGGTRKRMYSGMMPVKLVTEFDYFTEWPSFDLVSGIFGIAGVEICCRNFSLWSAISRSYGVFGLDVNIPLPSLKHDSFVDEASATLYLGHHSAYTPMKWSERKQTGGYLVNSLYRFTIYNLKTCDTNLLDGLSGSWEAEIDISSECLVVPSILFKRIVAWLPVDASSCSHSDTEPFEWQKEPVVCTLYTNETEELPVISFTLSDDHRDPLKISIADLIYYNKKTQRSTLCIAETFKSNYSIEIVPSMIIKFGTAVLNSLYTVVDVNQSIVGFAQKNSTYENNNLCKPKASCRGNQTFDAASNTCIDPHCGVFLLMTLDDTTKTCTLASFAAPLAYTAIALLGIMELLYFLLYQYTTKVISQRCR